jgi:hypothetical protein
MADNVALPATGVSAATDEVAVNGGTPAHVQFVKLVDGAANGTDGLPGGATNGLRVDVRQVIPGTGATNLGKTEDAAHTDGDVGVLMLGVRNHQGASVDGDYSALSTGTLGDLNTLSRRDLLKIAVGVTGVTTASTAYTAGDQVGVQITFANAARATSGGGTIVGATLIDQSDIMGPVDLVIFDATATLAADNAAFAISDADSVDVVAVIQLSGAIDLGANRIVQSTSIAIPYVCNGGTSLFGALITRSAHTFFTAGALPQVNLYVERN